MSDFSSFIRNENYIKTYTKQMDGKEKGLLYIEDPSDRTFWQYVLDNSIPNRFEIKPYSQDSITGKKRFIKEIGNLNSFFVIAVDGDFDYLCKEKNQLSIEINSNPYILHTFSYSIESLYCCMESIHCILNGFHLYEACENQFMDSLVEYSSLIYDVFCLFTYLHNKDCSKYLESDFNEAIKLSGNERLLDDSLLLNKKTFSSLNDRVNAYKNILISDVNDHEDFLKFKSYISDSGVDEKNILMFINGHYLKNQLVKNELVVIKNKVQISDIDFLKRKYSAGECLNDKINQVRNRLRNEFNIDTILNCNTYYTNNNIWFKIIDKAKSIP
ncbi:DUF4435 domain-containing protein [Providencia stuartii]|uniref:DUF4435 domain-containing protein n=1 Tax=Providencia stuartii TaxID=588 RepID=UPI001B3DAB31|nr:DUF4435 domain-containing protein [Providencia stuartii]MBQ0695844.1 DUF4435 domain-containing protein [Providencia stuartii]